LITEAKVEAGNKILKPIFGDYLKLKTYFGRENMG